MRNHRLDYTSFGWRLHGNKLAMAPPTIACVLKIISPQLTASKVWHPAGQRAQWRIACRRRGELFPCDACAFGEGHLDGRGASLATGQGFTPRPTLTHGLFFGGRAVSKRTVVVQHMIALKGRRRRRLNGGFAMAAESSHAPSVW
jgi:hypothetical protein